MVRVPGTAVCGYHVFGTPLDRWYQIKGIKPVQPSQSGLEIVPGGTSCRNCKAYESNGKGKGLCHLVYDEGKPANVEALGCCARWEPKEARDDIHAIKSRPLARRMKFQGLDVSIETDKGQYRHWEDPHSGESGSTKMQYPYGYVRMTVGADGDHHDIFVGPNEASDKVFVIDQMKKPDFTEFDEHKTMLGFDTAKEAKAAYLAHYSSPKFFGGMKELTMQQFKDEHVSKNFGMMAPMNNPMMPMGPMGPPPIDVESFEGVHSLLGRIGSIKDDELIKIAEEIWGDGFQYQNTTPAQAKAEINGFLMDQRDLLGIEPLQHQMQPSPSLPTYNPQGSSEHSDPFRSMV
jgi:hypothetical protein